MLRTNTKKLDDVIGVVASSQSPSVEVSIENAEQQQSACTAMTPNSAEGEMLVYLNPERETAVALEVPREATVATLVAAAASSGVDLRRRTLRFCGESLSDHSTPLADIGVGAEAVIDVSRFVWNRESLKELQPIFEAEVVVQGGDNKIVFLQWDDRSDFDLEFSRTKPIHIEMHLCFRTSGGKWTNNNFLWSPDQRAVLMYLQRNKILGFDQYDPAKFIELDLSEHTSWTDSGTDIDLPLQCALPGVIHHSSAEQWSVVLRRVAHFETEVADAVES